MIKIRRYEHVARKDRARPIARAKIISYAQYRYNDARAMTCVNNGVSTNDGDRIAVESLFTSPKYSAGRSRADTASTRASCKSIEQAHQPTRAIRCRKIDLRVELATRQGYHAPTSNSSTSHVQIPSSSISLSRLLFFPPPLLSLQLCSQKPGCMTVAFLMAAPSSLGKDTLTRVKRWRPMFTAVACSCSHTTTRKSVGQTPSTGYLSSRAC